MAASAQARREVPASRPEEHPELREARPAARRVSRARRSAAQRARLTRAFVIFVVCLTVLAVGRVALSFAVVQKTIETDAIAREHRALTAENAQLEEDLAQMGSAMRIRHIAEKQLGLVDADHVQYLRVSPASASTEVAERP